MVGIKAIVAVVVVNVNAVLGGDFLKRMLGKKSPLWSIPFGRLRHLPRLGCGEDFVRRFRLFATRRNLGHRAEQTSGALGKLEQGQFLGDFAIEGKLHTLQFG